MRPEKQYLVEEVSRYLAKSEYVFIADYTRITVADTAELRQALREVKAEYHVVKNSILQVAAQARHLPDLRDVLSGQNAIVVGGRDVAGVAKVLEKFFKDRQKLPVRGGALGARKLTPKEVTALAELPPLEVMRAQFLGLLNAPASSTVRILQAVPQGLINVLQSRSEQTSAA